MVASGDVRRVALSFVDIPTLAGQTFVGEWIAVQTGREMLFESATYVDQNANPFDEGAYPDRLVEGFHLLGLLDQLIGALIQVTDRDVTSWSYGLERARFVTPVESGDRLRLHCRITGVDSHYGGWLVRTSNTVELEGSSKPAYVVEWLILFSRPL